MNREEMGSTADEQLQEQICKQIFDRAMNGKWIEVVTIYREDKRFNHRAAKITRAGDTALHVAVMDGQEDAVENLVRALMSSRGLVGAREALEVENERGNTPLHLAAAQGSTKMCHCIASVDSTLIGKRNKESETPFFLAAERGKKETFLCLHRLCGGQDKGYAYCRKNNGETILHSAIYGEYFDLVFIILHEYGKLANYVNEQGFSPLHLLASKPSAFRSGSRLGRFNQIIYHCTFVDKLKEVETIGGGDDNSIQQKNSDKKQNYPPNYHMCASVLGLFPKVFLEPCDKWTEAADAESQADEAHGIFPPNYGICFEVSKFMSKAILIVLGFGSRAIKKVREKKEKHTWSVQIMDELLQLSSTYEYEYNGQEPKDHQPPKENETTPYDLAKVKDATEATADKPMIANPQNPSETSLNDQNKQDEIKVLVSNLKWRGNGYVTVKEIVKNYNGKGKKETPILIAAKNGVTEMVEKILEKFPVAIHDVNIDKKNVVLLAVENRQPHVYKLLKERKILQNSVFQNVDKDGNSALHLAATLGEHRPWLIPGAALQMQWELKWYEYVKNSMPLHFFGRYNKKGQTSRDIFSETHMELVKVGGEWLTNTSKSCSVVAALIAAVAFATASTVPGGVDEKKGTPTLENQPPFSVFAISSLVALCFSVMALVMFLAILTSRYQEKDFRKSLPRRVLVGLTSLFVSIASMLISFCAGHFFVLKDNLKFAALPVYAVTCLPVSFFAIAQFPLYFDLIWATIKKVPQRSYRVIAS